MIILFYPSVNKKKANSQKVYDIFALIRKIELHKRPAPVSTEAGLCPIVSSTRFIALSPVSDNATLSIVSSILF